MESIKLKIGIGNKEMEKGLEKVKELNDCLNKANKIIKELDEMGIKATVEPAIPAPTVYNGITCGCN